MEPLPTVRELELLQLGASLRKLRRSVGLTGETLGRHAHMSQSKISKIEKGRVSPSPDDMKQLLDALQPSDEARHEIQSLFDALQLPDGDYRKIERLGLAWKQRQIRQQEAGIRVERVFELNIIPGLLQTEDHARSLFMLLSPITGDELEETVRARLSRQKVIWQVGRVFEFVVLEGALCALYCSVETQLAQLDHIYQLSSRSNIRFGVVPRSTTPPIEMANAFAITNDEYVSAETVTLEVAVTNPPDVDVYLRHFKQLCSVAVFDSEARVLVHTAMKQLETHDL